MTKHNFEVIVKNRHFQNLKIWKISKTENSIFSFKIWKSENIYQNLKSENIFQKCQIRKYFFKNVKPENIFRNLEIFGRVRFFFCRPNFFFSINFFFFHHRSENFEISKLRGKIILSLPSCRKPIFVVWAGSDPHSGDTRRKIFFEPNPLWRMNTI